MNLLRSVTLAAIWCVLTRELSPWNAALGLGLGALLVRISGPGRGASGAREERPPGAFSVTWRKALARPLVALELAGFFLWELLHSNVRIALLMLRPKLALRPTILDVPVDVRSEEELAVLSDLVTLTPGTLSLDVSDDGRTLFVHVLLSDDPDETRRAIRDGLARRVRRLFS